MIYFDVIYIIFYLCVIIVINLLKLITQFKHNYCMDNVKLFKVRVSIRNKYVFETYDTIGFNDRDRILVNFALQLGYSVNIKNIDDETI